MRVVKPMSLGLLYRTFERERRFFLVVSALGYFAFDRSRALLAEVDMWKDVGEALGPEGIVDEGMPKPEREVLVHGFASAPGGKPATVCKVRLHCAGVDKTLYAIGDRFWKADGVASDPLPFERMPVRWEYAFGGESFAANPRGKGIALVDGRQPLPNIEDPRALIKARSDRPEPACFAGYEPGWPQRTRFAGTYDAHWLEELAPGWPDDFDLHYYCVAPPDQRLAALAADEAFVIDGMHPDKPRVEGRLPAIAARCFVRERGAEVLREVALGLETVQLLPHLERGVAIYRGVTEVREDDAHDIEHLLLAAEDASNRRELDHYQRSLAERLDGEHGALRSLREDDLLPERQSAPPDLAKPSLITERMRRRAELELERVRGELEKQGIDPDAHGVPRELPPPEPVPSLAELPAYLDAQQARAESLRQEAEVELEAAEARARELSREAGIDYDAAEANAGNERGGPPAFRAEREIERLRDQFELARNAGVPLPHVEAQLADEGLADKLRRIEQQLFDVYRRFAHHQEPVTPANVDRKRELIEAVQSGASIDFTGADLGGVALSGAMLRGALLESASLAGADLSGADLTDAVLTRANLTGAKLSGATLTRANLGAAVLRGADMSGAALEEAVLAKADLTGARMARARLANADVADAVMVGADLEEAVASHLMLHGTRLDDAKLARATLDNTIWIEIAASSADLSEADLSKATFVGCSLAGASFARAKLDNARFVGGTKLAGATLVEADLTQACLRECDLSGADLSRARLDAADLGACHAEGANFYRAVADGAHFVRACLKGARMVSLRAIQALFTNADLRDADLSGANLFRCDLLRVRLSRSTRLGHALVEQSRFRERRSHEQG